MQKHVRKTPSAKQKQRRAKHRMATLTMLNKKYYYKLKSRGE